MPDSDSRIPVCFGTLSGAAPGTALLVEGDAAVPAGVTVARFTPRMGFSHGAGCACCMPRDPVSEALSRLFLASARGESAPLLAVVAVTRSQAGRQAVCAALEADPLSRVRFCLA